MDNCIIPETKDDLLSKDHALIKIPKTYKNMIEYAISHTDYSFDYKSQIGSRVDLDFIEDNCRNETCCDFDISLVEFKEQKNSSPRDTEMYLYSAMYYRLISPKRIMKMIGNLRTYNWSLQFLNMMMLLVLESLLDDESCDGLYKHPYAIIGGELICLAHTGFHPANTNYHKTILVKMVNYITYFTINKSNYNDDTSFDINNCVVDKCITYKSLVNLIELTRSKYGL